MAARKKNKDLPSRRRRACGEDRLSALSDDLLLQILRCLDTRTALRAAALSRRWAHLPRELPVLDLKVTDALPPRYKRCLLLLREARRSHQLSDFGSNMLTDITGRYERRATRSMAASVESLLASGASRRATRLSLEVFAMPCSSASPSCIARLVADAIDSWGIRDLELVATPTGLMAYQPPVYSFPPSTSISAKPAESRLQCLKLANCLPPSLDGFTALTTLVLQGLPESTPAAVYRTVLAACPQLQVLRLISCRYRYTSGKNLSLVFNAPNSQIRELVIDGPLIMVELSSLPKLQSLTVLHSALVLSSATAAPCLTHVSFVFSVGPLEGNSLSFHYRNELDHIFRVLMRFFERAISMTDLALRFTGPGMWIGLKNPVCLMANLRKLLVAEVPSSRDVSGPLLLIEAAPLLETIHVHVDPKSQEEPGQEIPPWQPSTARHCRLKELVVVGFQTTARHLGFVKYTVEASMALSRVALFKHGHVKDKGPCGWEMVTQQSKWSKEEKLAVLDGISCSADKIEVTLG